MLATDLLAIGDLARRTGCAVSAIRFYERRGLVASLRTSGNQRRYPRSEIRRLSFILIAQRLARGEQIAPGARPCLDLIDLDEYLATLKGFDIEVIA